MVPIDPTFERRTYRMRHHADEPIIKFISRAEADELIAALQIQDVQAQLTRWSSDVVEPQQRT